MLPFFDWILTYNTGAAFSFLADAGGWQRWFFVALALVVSAWCWRWLNREHDARVQLALTLIIGGALGNVIDRIWLGKVIDFILVYWAPWNYYYPAFNVADSAISMGAVLMLWDFLHVYASAVPLDFPLERFTLQTFLGCFLEPPLALPLPSEEELDAAMRGSNADLSAMRSILLTAAITGIPAGNSAATSRSAAVIRVASSTSTATSTPAKLSRTVRLSRSFRRERCRVWNPGVSTKMHCTSAWFTMPMIRCRVVCGFFDVMLIFSPTSAFSNVDLPTLGRPTIAV